MKRLVIFPVPLLLALFLTLSASAADYAVHGVTISGAAVTVSATAESNCALWVAVYDESGKMIAARSESVGGASDAQTVAISFDNISENAYAKAFLLDSGNFSPLTACGDTRKPSNEPESDVYAILYTDGTMVFQHGNAPQSELEIIETYEIDIKNKYQFDYDAQNPMTPWYSERASIQSVEFADKIQPMSTAFWFYGLANLKEIRNIKNLDTSKVTAMDAMFYGCSRLTALDVSDFNTANVAYMGHMFYRCSGLAELDVSNFDTAKVTELSGMFAECSGLTMLDVSNFDTANATIGIMFYGCSELNTIYASDKFVTNRTEWSDNMFSGCISLVGGNGTTYNDSHADYTYARIDGGASNPGYFTAKT
ncbi:MAG: BspA family leucine-rich repeat surface protein [Oscillibacter sp.]|nr:BspA family leucine-rich repeat surface protein [Oscillibacter sp.]